MANSQVCPTGCGVELLSPPASYQDLCSNVPSRVKFGGAFFGLLKCGVYPTDPTSLADWQALITSGDFVISPCGIMLAPRPTQESAKLTQCGGDEVLKTVHEWNFETHESAADRTDHAYWEELACSKQYRVVRFDCDGWMYVQDEYYQFAQGNIVTAPTSSPGFGYTVTNVPHAEEGEADYQKWSITFSIELDGCTLIKPIYVEGLYAALQGA